MDEILPHLHGKTIFSVVDTRKGYWHVPLDKESSLLTTFNTPFGRYKFNRLPFGIVVSHDIFQKRLDEVYKNITNVHVIEDDIIVCGANEAEHDCVFENMMQATRAANTGLNSTKLQYKQSSVKFYGHVLTVEGIRPSEDKLAAIKNIKIPKDAKEVETILGMICI